ncbi:uncharacterized protein BJ171DRAFT_554743 [Polychytrium aggregatum]|uniref:uncharacterized protein n=1 Tax=Polychytrium aggregatum TaxID=110093 RepID=UPI0022FE2677|nr:uncharacterized protein BJ171DRAFT_554743 [Polychytrium aggregatum]KAI9183744.1 hypothetical protein BJ171DRAFT_554743 [Polychytrium aggregatum]
MSFHFDLSVKPPEGNDEMTNFLSHSLVEFFGANPRRLNEVIYIILRQDRISLRMLDWFIVNYSRRNSVRYRVDGAIFYVYENYKAQLRAYSKKRFDPFRRFGRFTMTTLHPQTQQPVSFETTIGQLCFFKWCIQNRVIAYIRRHFIEIFNVLKRKRINRNKGADKFDQELDELLVESDAPSGYSTPWGEGSESLDGVDSPYVVRFD